MFTFGKLTDPVREDIQNIRSILRKFLDISAWTQNNVCAGPGGEGGVYSHTFGPADAPPKWVCFFEISRIEKLAF